MKISNLLEVYEVDFITNLKLEIPWRNSSLTSCSTGNLTFVNRTYTVKELVNLILNVHETPHETYSVEHAAIPLIEEILGRGRRHERLQVTLPLHGQETTVAGKPDLIIEKGDFNVVVEHKGIHLEMSEREFQTKSRYRWWWESVIPSRSFERHALQSLIYGSMESCLRKVPTVPVIAYTPYKMVDSKAEIYAVVVVYPSTSFSPSSYLLYSMPSPFGNVRMEWLSPEGYLVSILEEVRGRAG
ncbi:hypothetical protein IC006_0455 [Sulfuracidifex tepidarius]|uniref:Uncharacterized protein n=2 Tax=Sulfuracidifex tepidarius TaxID=1294262 RepID=A0A510DSL3_9CREN|nr:hypothetical protein [Sulfuracidifex tepidarius]BBG23171.1 hypothetical protein IC006_0455 [Sulfuracidifex tepidarius]